MTERERERGRKTIKTGTWKLQISLNCKKDIFMKSLKSTFINKFMFSMDKIFQGFLSCFCFKSLRTVFIIVSQRLLLSCIVFLRFLICIKMALKIRKIFDHRFLRSPINVTLKQQHLLLTTCNLCICTSCERFYFLFIYIFP